MRIKDILEDMIFLSNLNNKMEDYHFKPVDLGGILIESLEKVESIAIIKSINLEFIPTFDIVWNAMKKLVRASINLLPNGIKFSETRVNVELREEISRILVVISDEVDGFSSESLDKVFK